MWGLIGLKGIGTNESSLGGALWQGDSADDFLERYFDNPTVAMKIYISKAERMGILQKGANNGLYLNGSVYCGQTVDEAVVHFTTDVAAYTNIIQPEVNKMSKLPVDDMVEVNLDPKGSLTGKAFRAENRANNEKSSVDYSADYRRLFTEYAEMCPELGEKMDEGIRYNELKIEVARLRKALDAKRKADASPTGKLMNEVDDLLTDDVDLLRSIGTSEGVKGLHLYKDGAKIKERIREHRKQNTSQPVV